MKSKINISDVLKKHKETLKSQNYHSNGSIIEERLEISCTDKFIFYLLPIIISFSCILLIGRPQGIIVGLYTGSLSLFIGLFLNMLVLILSFLDPNYKTEDKENRKRLITHTFYNISYTVVASLIALGYLFISLQELFPTSYGVSIEFIKPYIAFENYCISTNTIIQYFFSILFYYMASKVVLTLLMVIKRVFSLFNVDIKNT